MCVCVWGGGGRGVRKRLGNRLSGESDGSVLADRDNVDDSSNGGYVMGGGIVSRQSGWLVK